MLTRISSPNLSPPALAGRRFPLTAVALAGAAWNAFGMFQLARLLAADPSAMPGVPHPAWLNAAFAVAVVGGFGGCILLALRRAEAPRVLSVSLAGYAALFVGDITEGVFAALGPSQIAIILTALAIAIGLRVGSSRALREERTLAS